MMCPIRHNLFQCINFYSGQYKNMKIIIILAVLQLATSEIISIKTKKSNTKEDCSENQENNKTSISLGNCGQYIYFIELGIGTPPQIFNFQLDTTTQLIWFPMKNGFDFDDSSTVQVSPKIRTTHYHEQKNVTGYAGSDFVTLQETNISARSLILWVQQNVHIIFQPEISGIVGLGYSEVPNFFDRAYEEGQIESPVFALQMSNSKQNSMIYYNIIPQPITFNTQYVPIIGKEYWTVRLRGFHIQENDFSYYANTDLILDSGINQIKLNQNLYDAIKQEYFTNCSNTSKLSILDCSCELTFPKLSFILDELQVFLHGHSYVQKLQKRCLVKIERAENIVLGDIFFKEYVLTFDKEKKRLGFMGDLLPVHFIGSSYFELSQYIVMSLSLFAVGFGSYLLCYLKIGKRKQKSAHKLTPSFIQLP